MAVSIKFKDDWRLMLCAQTLEHTPKYIGKGTSGASTAKREDVWVTWYVAKDGEDS
jgi:hypothetical protein